ncbi:MAG: type 1 glutamine amidotransferase [Rhodospirillales bacterium]|nr:type 1 glutamine amidotransferase [Rhodospirillales bacterium]
MTTEKMKRIFFIEMMGVRGSYDASVYDHFDDKDDEGRWFVKRYGHVAGISINTRNVCAGEALPIPDEVDGLVLAGSYNSVHDKTDWQRAILRWLPAMREHKTPILAICGSHQLISHSVGARVEHVEQGPYAGTFPVALTDAGRSSPVMNNIPDGAKFHFANSEYVLDVPAGGTLLASSGRVPVAALDFGHHCYATQFHPEGTHETLGTVWRHKAPELMDRYVESRAGDQLVENFLRLVIDL